MADRRCVIIELELVDKVRILKYLDEHVYSYNWILREDNEKVRLCVWWREYEHKPFSVTPLRSFLKRLKNKAQYNKIIISSIMNTDAGVQALCEWESGSIQEHHLEEPLTTYLQSVLSTDSLSMNYRSELTTNKTAYKRIMKDICAQDISIQLDLLQKIANMVVPQVKEQLVRPTLPEESASTSEPTLNPEGIHHLSRIQILKDEIQTLNEEIYTLKEEIQILKPELPELPFEQSLPMDDYFD